jgi:hypothetical protein
MRRFLQSMFMRVTRQRPLFTTKTPQRFSLGQVVGYTNGPIYRITHIIEVERDLWQVWGRVLQPSEARYAVILTVDQQ